MLFLFNEPNSTQYGKIIYYSSKNKCQNLNVQPPVFQAEKANLGRYEVTNDRNDIWE